jgi:cell division protein FtsW (lipid II flippase)
MPEWLQTAVRDGDEISLWTLILRLVLSFGLGAVVAGIYRWTHRRDEAPAPSFLTTLVLMTIVIAMSTQVIGDNVARAFSLVGALSIVRFRTVVQDTRDTAYVIFAVVVGMAAGAGHLAVAIVGIVITGVASFVMRPQTFAWEARDNALLRNILNPLICALPLPQSRATRAILLIRSNSGRTYLNRR